MAEIKVGDAVRLKTGGPAMVVESISKQGKAELVWFVDRDGESEADRETLPVAGLVPAAAPPEQPAP